jgi:hypothetical protein
VLNQHRKRNEFNGRTPAEIEPDVSRTYALTIHVASAYRSNMQRIPNEPKESKMRLFSIVFSVLTVAVFSTALQADDMPKRSPELQVLERFIGTWEHELTIKPAGAEASTINTVDYRFWSRGERILHFSNPTDDPELHFSLTYDPESKTYPGVLLIGSTRATVSATWDAKKQTMVFSMKYTDGSTYSGEHRFIGKDRAEASGIVRNSDGDVVLELQWKQNRRKNSDRTFADSVNANDTPKRSAELQVSDRLVGTWDSVLTDETTGMQVDAAEQGWWSEKGKFVLFKSFEKSSKKESYFFLVTYDANGKVYRACSIDESAASSHVGTWNGENNTMTWNGTDSVGNKWASTHRFFDMDHSEWSMVSTNPDGKVVSKLSGKMTRRKK